MHLQPRLPRTSRFTVYICLHCHCSSRLSHLHIYHYLRYYAVGFTLRLITWFLLPHCGYCSSLHTRTHLTLLYHLTTHTTRCYPPATRSARARSPLPALPHRTCVYLDTVCYAFPASRMHAFVTFPAWLWIPLLPLPFLRILPSVITAVATASFVGWSAYHHHLRVPTRYATVYVGTVHGSPAHTLPLRAHILRLRYLHHNHVTLRYTPGLRYTLPSPAYHGSTALCLPTSPHYTTRVRLPCTIPSTCHCPRLPTVDLHQLTHTYRSTTTTPFTTRRIYLPRFRFYHSPLLHTTLPHAFLPPTLVLWSVGDCLFALRLHVRFTTLHTTLRLPVTRSVYGLIAFTWLFTSRYRTVGYGTLHTVLWTVPVRTPLPLTATLPHDYAILPDLYLPFGRSVDLTTAVYPPTTVTAPLTVSTHTSLPLLPRTTPATRTAALGYPARSPGSFPSLT